MDTKLLDILACPVCKGPLKLSADKTELISKGAGLAYPIRDGIPVMLETEARDLDVHALHQGFLRAMRRAGGILQCDAQLSSATREGGHWKLTLADGRQLRAHNLVNAAGAWADQVAQQCGVKTIGLQPCRRTAFTFDGPEGVDFSRWPAVIGIDESFYFKPDAGQLLGSPA
ncbi:FAD-dependent oxidoreductase, partial [Pseudomonas psychrophila]|uniref:FAD-dependent oxidoreductase n=1 Tax=Pseudomonas psychrophila TaxID=122355 RepID=UPI000AA0E5A8